jgi:hypothetical protein
MRCRLVPVPLLLVLCSPIVTSRQAASADAPATTTRVIAEPTEISGVPCRDFVRTYADGSLAGCRLSGDWSWRGQQLPRGTVVALAAGGELEHCFLPADLVIQGHECRGHGHDFLTAFHANGRLSFCNLAADETIDGLPCRGFGFLADVFRGGTGVRFHDDGRLQSCMLAQDFTIEGKHLRKGDRVSFDRQGELLD